MDRQIVYPAQIPLDSDQLNAQRNAYVGLGQLAAMAYGWTTVSASGFACAPGAGLAVVLAPGSLLAPGVVDGTAYGTLAAVASALVRQYGSRDPVTLAVPGAGATYTVYVTPATVDGADTVLPFYNAADPSVTYAGADNSGNTAPTVRQDVAQPGIGTSVPTGAYALWTITVPAGATSITAGMITQAEGAPFYDTIPQLQAGKQDSLGFTPVQQGGGADQGSNKVYLGWEIISGTSTGRLRYQIDATDIGALANYADVTAEQTARASADAALSTRINGCVLQQSDSATNPVTLLGVNTSDYRVRAYDPVEAVWKVLANYSDVEAVQATIGELTTAWGYVLASDNIAVPAWATSVEIEAVGAGGGGGGCQGSSTAETVSGGGGASGGYIKAIYPVAGGDTLGITIGAGGGGGEGALPGNEGGTTVVSLNGTELFYIPGGGGSGKPTTANTAGGGGSMPVVVTPATAAYYTCGNSGSDGQAGNWVFAGNGAPSVYGGAGRAGNNGGQPATSPGAGGGGAYDSGMTGSAHDGGAGGIACVTFRFIP